MSIESYRRWHRDWRWKRLSGEMDLRGLNHPWIHVGADGEDWAWVAVGFGSTGADPVWHVELSLAGTWAGRLMCDIAYRWRCWRWKKRDASAASQQLPHNNGGVS